jgi:16S rRNA (adenine(1408)-N(1))-methyltransferase
VLRAARAEPDTLVIGVDADASSMIRASRTAALPIRKGGLPNAAFVVAAAESLPAELDGVADEIRVHFPWGSLLRGVVGRDDAVLRGVTRLAAPGAEATVLVSLTERDHAAGVEAIALEQVVRAWRERGFELVVGRAATIAEVGASHSTWAKRLRVGIDRDATRLVFRRPS